MKKLLAILSVVLFANHASAEDDKWWEEDTRLITIKGRAAELILMHGDVLHSKEEEYRGLVVDKYVDEYRVKYHVKLSSKQMVALMVHVLEQGDKITPEETRDIESGIYICSVYTFNLDPYYFCRRTISKS